MDDDERPDTAGQNEIGAQVYAFAVVLLVACGLVVTGVALWSPPLAFVAAGVLLAGWAWLVLST